jgi:hypothetical protein
MRCVRPGGGRTGWPPVTGTDDTRRLLLLERRASVGCVRACVYPTEFADIFLDAGPGSVPDESLLAAAASALLHCARLPGAPASAGKAADTGHASCMRAAAARSNSRSRSRSAACSMCRQLSWRWSNDAFRWPGKGDKKEKAAAVRCPVVHAKRKRHCSSRTTTTPTPLPYQDRASHDAHQRIDWSDREHWQAPAASP